MFKFLKNKDLKNEKGMVVDPICGMKVDPKTARFKTEKNGETWYFCSKDCQEKFEEQSKQSKEEECC